MKLHGVFSNVTAVALTLFVLQDQSLTRFLLTQTWHAPEPTTTSHLHLEPHGQTNDFFYQTSRAQTVKPSFCISLWKYTWVTEICCVWCLQTTCSVITVDGDSTRQQQSDTFRSVERSTSASVGLRSKPDTAWLQRNKTDGRRLDLL